jgi:START domain
LVKQSYYVSVLNAENIKTMRFFLTFLLLLSCFSIFSQDNWELQKDKENIKVYTKKVDGFSMKSSKVTSVLETTIPRLVAVMMDADNFYKVISGSKSSKLLKIINDTERIYYVSTEAPWPVSDRDGVYSMTFSQNPNTESVTITVGCLPDYIPEKEGYVRVPASEGVWKFTPLSNGKVEVTYHYVADPGGSIPAWLANSSVVNIPFETIKNLKKQVALNQYEGQTFSFLEN